MAHYAIGDIQGCLEPLQRLLHSFQYNQEKDHLIFAGDLINRGPDNLAALQFIKNIPHKTIVFGNHDLHTMACFYGFQTPSHQDTLDEFINAPHLDDLMHWWRQNGTMMAYFSEFNACITHAGIPPEWDFETCTQMANKVTDLIRSEAFIDFLPRMYGNMPTRWADASVPEDQYRFTINALTRMRLVDEQGGLELKTKTPLHLTPKGLYPWFEKLHPSFPDSNLTLLFGHWAALEGRCPISRVIALDSGCVWGGKLAAYRLEDGKRFEVAGLAKG